MKPRTVHSPAFEVSAVRYKYDRVTALDDLSLEVQQGERVALLGANGSGKSTLLRVLAGLYFPESGAISFFGEPLTEERFKSAAFSMAFRRRVGLVFQNPDVQLFNPSVFDELAFGPLQIGWSKDKIRQRIGETLEVLGIAHLKERPPHRLSGGEKKRVALASVLILNPEILLLDEPTAALDPASQTQIIDLLVSWGGGSKTVVTATHDLDNLESVADRCYVFQNGRIAAAGTPFEILHDVALLTRTGLIRAHRHAHDVVEPLPHPHVHEWQR